MVPFATPLSDISFTVRAGEIFGIAGVAGNGQAELLGTLSGETLVAVPEAVRIDGEAVGQMGPRRRRDRGMGFVPVITSYSIHYTKLYDAPFSRAIRPRAIMPR